MKNKLFALLSVVMILLAFPARVSAYNAPQDKVVLGGTYTLEAGDTLSDNLVIMGGTSTISKGATVNGNITMVGGTLIVDGKVSGDIKATGTNLTIGDSAVINGDVTTYAGTLNQSAEARITGNVTQNSNAPLQLDLPKPSTPAQPIVSNVFHPIQDALWFIFQCLALAAVAMLIALLFPKPLARLADATGTQPVLSGGIGILTLLAAPIALVFLVITLILIPVAVLAVIALAFGLVFGWIGFGTELGILFTRLIKQDWHIAISAGLGTLVLSVVMRAISYIPCIGWIFPFIAAIIGLGAVILTRCGSQYAEPAHPAQAVSTPVPPTVIPPQPPSEPASTPPQPPSVPQDPGSGNSINQ
jgi:hypothetical protein